MVKRIENDQNSEWRVVHAKVRSLLHISGVTKQFTESSTNFRTDLLGSEVMRSPERRGNRDRRVPKPAGISKEGRIKEHQEPQDYPDERLLRCKVLKQDFTIPEQARSEAKRGVPKVCFL